MIVKTIHEAFFKRKRCSSLAQKYPKLFTSSIDTGAGTDEPELPPAMVAMATVAVSLFHCYYASLTTPARFMPHWTRELQASTSMLTPTKTLTTLSLRSWMRSVSRNSLPTTGLCQIYINLSRAFLFYWLSTATDQISGTGPQLTLATHHRMPCGFLIWMAWMCSVVA